MGGGGVKGKKFPITGVINSLFNIINFIYS